MHGHISYRGHIPSFASEWLELLADAGAWDRERAVAALLDEAGVQELLDQVSSGLALLSIGLQHLHFHLHGVVVGELGLGLQLLELLGLLLGLDLLLGAASLAARLEEVGRDALAGYYGTMDDNI